MTSTLRALAAVSALVLAGSARAQQPESPDDVCRVQEPKIPVVNWRGQTAYRAKATVKNGRVVAVKITNLTQGVERRAQRSIVQAISESLHSAHCKPGDYVFETNFSFDIPPTAAASRASDGAR
jgi:hypothetical protein